MGIRWRDGDVPRLLVTFNRACSMGLGTVGVAGRPGGGGGDSFCVNLVDANGGRQLVQVFDARRDFTQHRGREGF